MKKRDRCAGQSRDGVDCRMWPVTGARYCYQHDPERETERAEINARRRRLWSRRAARAAAARNLLAEAHAQELRATSQHHTAPVPSTISQLDYVHELDHAIEERTRSLDGLEKRYEALMCRVEAAHLLMRRLHRELRAYAPRETAVITYPAEDNNGPRESTSH